MNVTHLPIIITRAEPGASETEARLRALSLTPIVAPMLSLQPRHDQDLPDPSTIAGLVFTSANGVRVFASRNQERTLPAWCVGPATAQAAHIAGFQSVLESSGNAVDLAHFISAHKSPEAAPLLHVANGAAAGTLKSTLEQDGHKVLFAPLYDMKPAETLASEVDQLMARHDPAIVLIHSQKGAEAFANLVAERSVSNLITVGISNAACKPMTRLGTGAIYVADAPNEDGLFAALQTAIATLSA
jgi:uroporphyrinogen-III synthase